MKINKLYLGLFSLLALMFTGCKDGGDDSYDWATVSGNQVFFSNELPATQEISKSVSSITIPIKRVVTTEAISVPLTVTKGAGSIYSIPASVSFAEGQSEAQIVVNYNPDDVVYGDYEDITIAIGDPGYATEYGNSNYSFKIGVTAWVKMAGQATYREDLVTTWWTVDNLVYKLDIEENIVEKGKYRIVNPYGAAYGYNDPGDWDDTKDYYITIDATDPDYVFVEKSELGCDWGYGMWSVQSYVTYYMEQGYTLEDLKSQAPGIFGKMSNGVITMPASSLLFSMADFRNADWYDSGTTGLFGVALPGAVFADYSVELAYAGLFTNPDNEVFAVGDLVLGGDATNVKAIVMSQDDDADAVADALASGELEGIDVEAGRIEVPIAEGLEGKLQMIVAVIADGAAQNVATANFEYYGGGNPWVSMGMGVYTENFISSLFGSEPVTYEVEVLQNTTIPGIYKMVYPYGEIYPYNDPGDWSTAGSYDIEIDATDPEGVVIYKQSTGVDWGRGEMFIQSVGAYNNVTGGYDLGTLKSYGYLGTLENGVITLPIFERETSDGGTAQYQGYVSMGSSNYYAGSAGEFKLVLPGSPALSAAKKVASKKAHAKGTKRFNGARAKIAKYDFVSNKRQPVK